MSKNKVKSYKCNIEGCESRKSESVPMFGIPPRPELRRQWINAIERNQEFNYTLYNFRVCALHFIPNQILYRGARCDLKNDAIPTLFRNNG